MELTQNRLRIALLAIVALALLPFISSKVLAASGLDDNVFLLLHGNAVDASTPPFFRDSSFSGHTITGTGNVISAPIKFSQSIGLFGAGTQVSVVDNGDFDFGTGDFTVETWVFFNTTTSGNERFFGGGGNNAMFGLQNIAGRPLGFGREGIAWDTQSGSLTWTTGQWYHVAATRQSGTLRIFRDGAQVASNTNNTNYSVSTSDVPFGNAISGFLDEVRVSKGVARYTANFTPPTAPFTSDASTHLLLHGDGTIGSTNFVDSSSLARTVTASGAKIDSIAKFGDTAICFDGSGDYTTSSTSADFNMQTAGDWTVDFWVRPNASSTQVSLVHINQGGNQGLHIQRHSTNQLRIDNGLTASFNAGTIYSFNWNHVAVARSGTTIYGFVNGTLVGTSTAQDYGNANSQVQLGRHPGAGLDFNGCLDEIRVSKGIARWTANFTPPTEAYGLSGITFTGAVKFLRNIAVVGSLSKGGGTFVIDHPQKPRTHLLYHSFVESNEVKNLYDGIAELDGNGEAIIRLPDYFEELNKDFRYQYFPIGESMPNLHVKEKVKNNQFVLAGGKPGGRVSWQVTGVRHDPYIEANPLQVEVEKGPGELVDKGECLHAEACQ